MVSKKEEYIPHKAEDKMFRKCPHCREVWIKTRGCDDWTYCGLVDEDQGDQQEDANLDYTVTFNNDGSNNFKLNETKNNRADKKTT